MWHAHAPTNCLTSTPDRPSGSMLGCQKTSQLLDFPTRLSVSWWSSSATADVTKTRAESRSKSRPVSRPDVVLSASCSRLDTWLTMVRSGTWSTTCAGIGVPLKSHHSGLLAPSEGRWVHTCAGTSPDARSTPIALTATPARCPMLDSCSHSCSYRLAIAEPMANRWLIDGIDQIQIQTQWSVTSGYVSAQSPSSVTRANERAGRGEVRRGHQIGDW